MAFENDPIGYAIYDFAHNDSAENIIVKADLCEDDILPPAYLFRNLDMMPEIEQKALSLCRGNILDVGAAAGCHAYELKQRGFSVRAIDQSKGAVDHLRSMDIDAKQLDFFDVEGTYDTVLVLMNGVGIAGKLIRLPLFLQKIRSLLAENGIALVDSTDLTYLYQEEDGSVWVDLNGTYHGEMQFKMCYRDVASEWFNWLYVDFDLLSEYADKAGLICTKIIDGESNNYLAELRRIG